MKNAAISILVFATPACIKGIKKTTAASIILKKWIQEKQIQ